VRLGHRNSAAQAAASDRRWLVLGVLGLAQLMVVLDGTIVNIALPSAQAGLRFSDGDRQWVITAYSLGFGSLLLLGGRLADRFGRRRMFLIGLVGFAVGSAAGGAAEGIGQLLAARAAQGAFAAVLAPAGLSLLTTTFVDTRERSKAFGIFGAIAGSGAAFGLLLGGVLTDYLSWRWCLFVNLGIATVAWAAGWVLLDRRRSPTTVPIDVPGVLTVTAGLCLLVVGCSHAESAGWFHASTVGYLATGVALLAAFVVLESRVAHPLLPLRVLADRNRAGAYLATFLVGMGMFGVFLFLTFYLQGVLGWSAIRTGLAFLPMTGAVVAASAGGSTLLGPRVTPKVVIPLGMLIAAAGMALFTRITVAGSYAGQVLPASIVLGVGLGTVFGFASNVATRGVADDDTGVASAMVNVGQQVGAALGTALLNTIAANAAQGYLAGRSGAPALLAAEAAVHSYVVGFWVAGAVFLTGALCTAPLLRRGVAASRPAYDDAVVQAQVHPA
jgi:EmrB/QacA subfamily drug resistance transporter